MLQTRAKIKKSKIFQKRCAIARTPSVLYLYLIILRLFAEDEGISGESDQQKAINTADDCKDDSASTGVGRNVCIRFYGNLFESIGLECVEGRG